VRRISGGRDPTGSPYSDDEAALRASLQALRDRTVPLPAAGTNAALWTHQGRFNLAFGIWQSACLVNGVLPFIMKRIHLTD
jgi:hypothetical protein